MLRHFASHYGEVIYIPMMAEHLDIPLEVIEFAFDNHRRTTVSHALLEYRLNRLCDLMNENPSGEITEQMRRCGLDSVEHTNTAFETYFGIDIVEYHQQCFLAAAARCQERRRGREQISDDWVSDLSVSITKESKFHR